MNDLEITNEDTDTIKKMYAATLKAERGYTGPVIVATNHLYELKKQECKKIAEEWIRALSFQARNGAL